jgi:hypothetical protein
LRGAGEVVLPQQNCRKDFGGETHFTRSLTLAPSPR